MSAGLEGSTALVTGAARGIGRGIADALLAAGAERVVGVDRDWEGLRADFERRGAVAVTADMGEIAGAELAEELLAEHGPFDRIVNNVGVATSHSFRSLTPEAFDRVGRVNLRAPLFLTQRLTAELIERGRPGAVLFVGSVHSRVIRGAPHYAATKAAIVALARELAAELAPYAIRVNVLSPGWIEADPAAGAGTEFMRAIESRIALGRRGEPGDVAPVALALLDDRVSGYVTGADVPVDGGLELHSWLDDLPDP